MELGCLNGRTMVKCDNSVFWVANDYTVRRLDGVTPTRISQDGIEQQISAFTIAQARAWSYTQEGHLFYVLTFLKGRWSTMPPPRNGPSVRPMAILTGWPPARPVQCPRICRQCITERGVSGSSGPIPTRCRRNAGILRMEWTYQPVYAQAGLAFHQRLETVVETGVGLATGQGSDP